MRPALAALAALAVPAVAMAADVAASVPLDLSGPGTAIGAAVGLYLAIDRRLAALADEQRRSSSDTDRRLDDLATRLGRLEARPLSLAP